MREPLLRRNPDFDVVTLHTLVGVASAVEQESAQRYAWLSQVMRQRGEDATAEAFDAMRQEELAHIAAVDRWAASLAAPLPPVAEFRWRLPPELAESWDEVAGSARLTPYKAFAMAALNEQRAFALYSYLSSQAASVEVARHAERLALEELRHAALMRRWRRKAWHEERRDLATKPEPVTSEAQLQALAAQHESAIDERLHGVVVRLQAIGAAEAADAVDALRRPHSTADALSPGAAGLPSAPVPLLNAAQEPLEAYSETLEGVLAHSDGPLFAAAESALEDVIRRLASIADIMERCRPA